MTGRESDMRKNKSKDMTLREASDYWDEHDIFESSAVKEEKELRFRFPKRKYVGLNEKLYLQIRRQAKKLHTSPDSLITRWLKQKAAAR